MELRRRWSIPSRGDVPRDSCIQPLAERPSTRGPAMSVRSATFASTVLALCLGAPSLALAADDPQAFVQQQHHHIEQLLHQPASAARDGQLRQVLSGFVDYDELTHRAFGEPCPATEPACE